MYLLRVCFNTAVVIQFNVVITSVTKTSISLSWNKPPVTNEMIIYYQVSST